MKLSIRQAYLAMFYFLDEFYASTKNDTLGYLLSGFNPYLWVDSMSADPAAWDDWRNAVKKITAEESLTSDEIFRATLEFVYFHQCEFGFELQWLINKMNAMSADDENWKICIEKAL